MSSFGNAIFCSAKHAVAPEKTKSKNVDVGYYLIESASPVIGATVAGQEIRINKNNVVFISPYNFAYNHFTSNVVNFAYMEYDTGQYGKEYIQQYII